MASLGFIGPLKILGLPLNLDLQLIPKLQVHPFIYVVGLLAILDPHVKICVGLPDTCIALKQFNLLPPHTLV